MRRWSAIFMSISVIAITMAGSFYFTTYSTKHSPVAIDGSLDISDWNFEEKSTLKLVGEWEFYPNELIVPEKKQDIFMKYTHLREKVEVPKSWEKDLLNKENPMEVGTYRLIIKVPDDALYGIKTNTIRYSSRLFLNGEQIGASGVPSENEREYRANGKKYVGYGKSEQHQLEVVVQVANQNYPTGGIIHAFDFGKFEPITQLRDRNRAMDALLIAGYLLLGLNGLASFLQRRNARFELYFCLFCFMQFIYMSTLNERLVNLVLPDMEIMLITSLQFTSIYLSVLFFLWFASTFFRFYSNKKTVIALSVLLGIQTLLFGNRFLLNKVSHILSIQEFQITMVISIGICILYILAILIRAFIAKTAESEYVLVIVVSFACYGALLGLDFLFEFDMGNIPVFLFLAMTITISFLIGYRFQSAFTQVERLSKELLTSDLLKDEFLAKTSSELKKPLHHILGLSQLLMEGAEGPLRFKQQESVMHIHNVGKGLSTIIEGFSDASTIKEEDLKMSATVIPISIIEDVLAEMKYLIATPESVEMISEIPLDLPSIFVDEQRFKQIMFNLLHNAIKFTKKGTINVSAKTQGENMVIAISDTGIGIGQEDIGQVFSSLFRVKSGVKQEAEGLGLGLTIAKQLVELSEGKIGVESEIGKGSVFTFTIRLATAEQINAKEQLSATMDLYYMEQGVIESVDWNFPMKVRGDQAFTILLVDDDVANLKVLLNLVSSLQYTVVAVTNEQDVFDVLDSEPVDLMILDLTMPNLSGYEICEIVRKDYHMIELPILLLTTAEQSVDWVTSFQVGANDYLRKPIEPKEVKVHIESLLAMKQSAQKAVHDELSYFYAQITPHFLYNTLNTIIALSYKDEEKTREALQHLSTYFRAKLDFYNHNSMIALSKELELVKSYLAIEQMRYGNRLIVRYEIDDYIKAILPSMTIQPLVENAIRHGISKKKVGGTLLISVRKHIDGVEICIQDDGIGISKEKQNALLHEKSDRIGFANTLKKLKLIKKSRFSLESEEGQGTKIIIILPEVKELESFFD